MMLMLRILQLQKWRQLAHFPSPGCGVLYITDSNLSGNSNNSGSGKLQTDNAVKSTMMPAMLTLADIHKLFNANISVMKYDNIKKYDRKAWTGLIWHRIGISGGFL